MQITDADKNRVINFLKNRLKEIKNIVESMEKDIKHKDPEIQATAIYLAGQFVGVSKEFFREMLNKEKK